MDHEKRTNKQPDCDETQLDPCGGLSHLAQGKLAELVGHADDVLLRWRNWRTGESWTDRGVSSWVPAPAKLEFAAQQLAPSLTCRDDESRVLPIDDEAVQAFMAKKIDRAAAGELEEWADYAESHKSVQGTPQTVKAIRKVFQLRPIPVRHEYQVHLTVGGGASVGLGAGGTVEFMGVKAAAGCYPMIGGDVQILRYSYSNNRDMKWATHYTRATAMGGFECALKFGYDGMLSGVPDDGMCTDSTESTTWYGPHDFTDVVLSGDSSAQVDAGVAVNGGASTEQLGLEVLRGLQVGPEGKPVLNFLELGACAGIGAAMGASISGTGSAGGQVHSGTPEVEAAPEAGPAAPAVTQPTHDRGRGPLRVLHTAQLWFPRGGDSAASGPHAAANQATLRRLVETLRDAYGEDPPSAVHVELVGHASAVWSGSRDEHARVRNNDRLAASRAQSAARALQSLYAALERAGWPAADLALDAECHDGQVQAKTRSEGSSESIAETGDPDNADAWYQRVDVTIRVPSHLALRRTVPAGS